MNCPALLRPGTAARVNRVRAGVGIAHLVLPGLGARLLGAQPFDRRARAVIRVLGVRQLAQARTTGAQPSAAVLMAGAEVDAAHALSMVALALFDRRWRRAAFADASVAAGFAALGAAMARAGAAPAAQSGLRDRAARRLVPNGFLRTAGPLHGRGIPRVETKVGEAWGSRPDRDLEGCRCSR